METVNALIDQQTSGDINIVPTYSVTKIANILSVLNEEETRDLLMSGESATWPKIPAIKTTTRVGRALDKLLHEFEIEEAHWLSTAPKTTASPTQDDDEGAGNIVKISRRSK